MTIFALPIGLLLAGAAVYALERPTRGRSDRRIVLGGAACAALLAAIAVALWAATSLPASSFAWGGGLALTLSVDRLVRVVVLLVPVVALFVVVWGAAHEPCEGLAKLLGGLVAFAGAMELLVLANDFLTLVVGWELVGALSFALIAHHHEDDEAVASASYAYNLTRLGGLGLVLAAGAVLATTGTFDFDALHRLDSNTRDLFAAGVLFAAASKSAQLPFSPWLFRAMAGPSAVSALLHSSTMVAAGAWLLVRLHAPLVATPWFQGAAIAIGLTTAIVAGVVALVQSEAKRLLAASTCAQYGFVFAAVGADAAGAGLVHIVTHAALKAPLFLAAGVAIGVAGSPLLAKMRLGRAVPVVAATSLVACLALAGVPPLGAAWSKEKILAGVTHTSTALGIVVVVAGLLSAAYATRFQLLVFGRGEKRDGRSSGAERLALLALAAATLALCSLWIPSVHEWVRARIGLPFDEGAPWELFASLASIVVGVGAVVLADRRGLLTRTERTPSLVVEWFGLTELFDLGARGTMKLARGCAALDDRVVDAGVRGAAAFGALLSRFASSSLEAAAQGATRATASAALVVRDAAGRVEALMDASNRALTRGSLFVAEESRDVTDPLVDDAVDGVADAVGRAGRSSRAIQTGAIPTYYSIVVGGLVAFLVCLALWR